MPWSLVANLNIAKKRHTGCGSQDSSLCIAGAIYGQEFSNTFNYSNVGTTTTEKYSNKVWLQDATFVTQKSGLQSCGTQIQAIAFCGYVIRKDQQKYNNTIWQSINYLNYGQQICGGAGTQSQALKIGGYTGGYAGAPGGSYYYQNICEKYNGTNWISSEPLLLKRSPSGFGLQDQAVCVGGWVNPSTQTNRVELYNGTLWSYIQNTNTNKGYHSSSGTANQAKVIGGSNTGFITESFNGEIWITYDNLNISRAYHQSGGINSNAIVFGGEIPLTNTAEINSDIQI